MIGCCYAVFFIYGRRSWHCIMLISPLREIEWEEWEGMGRNGAGMVIPVVCTTSTKFAELIYSKV